MDGYFIGRNRQENAFHKYRYWCAVIRMSYAEVVRFISVQPFPLQHHRLLLSLSLHFSRIRSFASPIFSCPTRLTPSIFFPLLFHILGPSALFHPVSALFTTLFSPSSFLRLRKLHAPLAAPFGRAHFSRNDRAKHRYFCLSSLFRWNFQCTSLR